MTDSAPLPRLQTIAKLLGGEVAGGEVRAPGPGHSSNDRSLCVRLNPNAPDGFIVFSHAGDDPIVCKDYVRPKIGLPDFAPKQKNGKNHFTDDDIICRYRWSAPPEIAAGDISICRPGRHAALSCFAVWQRS